MTTKSQSVRQAPRIPSPASALSSDTIHNRFHPEAELASASLTKRRHLIREEFIIITEPALGIDISKLKFNASLINTTAKLRHKLFPQHFDRL